MRGCGGDISRGLPVWGQVQYALRITIARSAFRVYTLAVGVSSPYGLIVELSTAHHNPSPTYVSPAGYVSYARVLLEG
ncbi:hypothetical protein R1flu_027917 [Riccia fluitans]|uniref:Uncharacterized protein n=1 Tax=Riccia fluitans TaxID=41844 RepID=A0ABD1XKP8_9MARC